MPRRGKWGESAFLLVKFVHSEHADWPCAVCVLQRMRLQRTWSESAIGKSTMQIYHHADSNVPITRIVLWDNSKIVEAYRYLYCYYFKLNCLYVPLSIDEHGGNGTNQQTRYDILENSSTRSCRCCIAAAACGGDVMSRRRGTYPIAPYPMSCSYYLLSMWIRCVRPRLQLLVHVVVPYRPCLHARTFCVRPYLPVAFARLFCFAI